MKRKTSSSAYTRRWREKHPEKAAIVHRRQSRRYKLKKFGLNEAQYDSMFKAQGGVCAVCGHPPGKRRLAVDHNHKTGQVRGLLCWKCNYGIGFFYDNPERFEKAAAYLRSFFYSDVRHVRH